MVADGEGAADPGASDGGRGEVTPPGSASSRGTGWVHPASQATSARVATVRALIVPFAITRTMMAVRAARVAERIDQAMGALPR